MRTATRTVVLLTALTLVSAACGDDSVLGPITPTTAAATTTTATLPATTAPATTEAPATTATSAPSSTTEAPPATTTTTVPPGPAMPILTPFDASETIADPPLDLQVVVPVVSGVPAPAAGAMNTLIGDEMLGWAASFKDEILSGDPVDGDYPAELVLGYTAGAVAPEILSIRFDVYLYYPGAAHGMSSIVTMNFDPQTGARLTLPDVLVPGTLGVLASLVEQALTDQLYGGNAVEASGWIPVLDEFVLDGWAVTVDGMEFSFDQYEVGFGAMGAPTVVIPWSALGAVIDPAGPAAGYAFP